MNVIYYRFVKKVVCCLKCLTFLVTLYDYKKWACILNKVIVKAWKQVAICLSFSCKMNGAVIVIILSMAVTVSAYLETNIRMEGIGRIVEFDGEFVFLHRMWEGVYKVEYCTNKAPIMQLTLLGKNRVEDGM